MCRCRCIDVYVVFSAITRQRERERSFLLFVCCPLCVLLHLCNCLTCTRFSLHELGDNACVCGWLFFDAWFSLSVGIYVSWCLLITKFIANFDSSNEGNGSKPWKLPLWLVYILCGVWSILLNKLAYIVQGSISLLCRLWIFLVTQFSLGNGH